MIFPLYYYKPISNSNSDIVFQLHWLGALCDLAVDKVRVKSHPFAKVLGELEDYSNEQILQLRKDVVCLGAVPGFYEDYVLRVEAEVGLEVVHDQGGLHISAQHCKVLW